MLSLSNIIIALFGGAMVIDQAQNEQLSIYKNSHLFNDEYKICSRGKSTYTFDEPFQCTTAEFTTFALETIGFRTVSTNKPDGVHILRELTNITGTEKVKIISNNAGNIMQLKLVFAKNPTGWDGLKVAKKTIVSQHGLPMILSKGNGIDYGWIATDGYDIRMRELSNRFYISVANRESYTYIEQTIRSADSA